MTDYSKPSFSFVATSTNENKPLFDATTATSENKLTFGAPQQQHRFSDNQINLLSVPMIPQLM
jgi:hypothetical protein